ncbi:hypothetical protein [Ruegeria sp. HKCCSP335]|uniref:hypothetical protein n=1 Tax=Ruegeria sp. HKCCSP335 TaxID=2794833 RepID=UPI001AE0FA50|nr:hypothetical protein [Ruegeria sp. HKCCSP335]
MVIRFILMAIFALAVSSAAQAQQEVRFTEAPKYAGSPCSGDGAKKLSYKKPPSNSEPSYKAMFGVWCAVVEQTEFRMAISSTEGFPGKQAHTVGLTFVTPEGLDQGFGVAMFDTRQKRWTVFGNKGQTWVMWPESGGRLGMGRGNYNGSSVKMHKGKKQNWVLLSRR